MFSGFDSSILRFSGKVCGTDILANVQMMKSINSIENKQIENIPAPSTTHQNKQPTRKEKR